MVWHRCNYACVYIHAYLHAHTHTHTHVTRHTNQDLEPPVYCECGNLEGVNAWFGTAGTVTPLHCDSYDNFLTQVVGFKYGA
jgi:hypothetical protein